eukprot:336278-Chlamydomonas_euryale.AAC.2
MKILNADAKQTWRRAKRGSEARWREQVGRGGDKMGEGRKGCTVCWPTADEERDGQGRGHELAGAAPVGRKPLHESLWARTNMHTCTNECAHMHKRMCTHAQTNVHTCTNECMCAWSHATYTTAQDCAPYPATLNP